jgi:hypothetical protein
MPPADPLPEVSRLTLVGTVHSDDRGFARIVRFLDSFQPDLIFVELSPYAKAFRDRNQATLQRTLNRNLRVAAGKCRLLFREALTHPEIKAIRRQLSLPLEFRAARRFSQATGSRLFLVDYSPFSRKLIALWPDLLASENLASLLSLPRNARPEVARIYDLAAQSILGAGSSAAGLVATDDDEPDRCWEKRERHLADTIFSHLHDHRPSKAVYLGGWLHLSIGGSLPSLRELLKIGLSQCTLLDRGCLQPPATDH